MPSPSRRLPRLLVVLATAVAVLTPQLATAQSIEQARAERVAIQQRLDGAATQLNDLEVRIAELTDESAALTREMAALQATADEATERVGARIRELYKRGIDAPVLQMLAGVSADEALERAELARHLLAGDHVAVETALAARTRATLIADQLEERRVELDAAQAEQQQVLAALSADLERAQALERRLVEEERRRQEEARRKAEAAARARAEAAAAASAAAPAAPAAPSSAPAPTSGGYACPVTQPRSYSDTWGAARSGSRRHQGTDILNPRGNEITAITSGVWDIRTPGGLAGNWAILRGSDGHAYYYMHLQQHLVGDGARVSAGQVVALNGDTGNARGTPHLHFEYHPGGGGAVNPYPLVRSLCG
jgi:peptidoglycan LD-endopeptidase LytH